VSAGLIDMLLARSARERLWLGLLVVVVLPVAVWFGVMAPLQQDRQAAFKRVEQERLLNIWVAERAGEMAMLAAVPTGSKQPKPPIGSAALEQGLIDAGLRPALDELVNRDGGEVVLRFEAVEFEALAAWLSASEPVWGYALREFRFEATNERGIVNASLNLGPAQ